MWLCYPRAVEYWYNSHEALTECNCNNHGDEAVYRSDFFSVVTDYTCDCVKARIQYKIACLCFQCLYHNTMPSYLSDILHPYLPPRTLRSLDTSLLTIPRFCLETYGTRSFSVFGPTVWNSLPLSLRKTQCFSTFKKKLKTYLFEKHLC